MKQLSYLIILIIFSYLANAQLKGELKSYSLNECIEIALQNNYDYKLAKSNINVANAAITEAFGEFLPSLNYSAGYNRQLNTQGGKTANLFGQIIPIPQSNPNSYNMSAGATYPIFTGFSREANYSKALDSYESTDLNVKHIAKKVEHDVYLQYIDIINKRETVKTRKENYELGRQQLDRIQAQFSAGTIAINVVYSQEADLANKEYDIITAEAALSSSKSTILSLMGLKTDISVDFSEKSVPKEINDEDMSNFRKAVGDYSTAISDALNNRQDFTASNFDITAAEAGVRSVSSGYYPTLSAATGWSWANSELNQFGDLGRTYVGLNFTLPIFDNFRTKLNVENANLQLEQKKIAKLQLEQSIRTALTINYDNLEAAERLVNVAKKAVEAAEKNYESSKERFDVGKADIIEYQNANNQLIISKINKISAVYNYFKAQKELLYSIGKF